MGALRRLLMQAWKIAPAIAMGCTMVMKLSEKTPLSGLMMCHLFVEAGIPAGVLNMVNGYGDPTGSLIARHMDIKKVAFTGSSAVGHKIVAMAAESNLKKVTLELGGKSAMIICKDADLDEAAINCHVGLFINMGQCCCASSRILIHEDVHDAFVAKVVELAKTLRTQGDHESETAVPICDLGPQIDDIQFKKIMSYIESGKAEGAKCLLGGDRLGSKGYYVQPTIFTDVADDMTIAKGEHKPAVVCHRCRRLTQTAAANRGDLRPGDAADEVQDQRGGRHPRQRLEVRPGRRCLLA